MANLDITRHLLTPSKNYVGAGMQQGRTLLDSDWNEDVLLRDEDIRLTLNDLLGAQGSTNAGFAVGQVDTDVSVTLPDGEVSVTYDFGLLAGSFYVGGMRLQIDTDDEKYLSQIDWLQVDASAENLQSQPTVEDLLGPAPNTGYVYTEGLEATKRYDLVYVEAWEQPVTAVEDAELRERALGGPDSSARVRRMRRIHVRPNTNSDNPSKAFVQMQFSLENGLSGNQEVSLGTLDPDSLELRSAARLTVTPIAELGDQPCGPKPPSGYTGHEDQAIRVELRGPQSIVWGFNNAAPLYRVRVGVGRNVAILNSPRDNHLQPKAGQIVELIAWGSKLPNDEKIAELTGHLVRVAKGYDPATGEIELAGDLPAALVKWHEDHTGHWSDRDELPNYLYMRVWDRGGDSSSDVIIDAANGIVPLGNTGLQLALAGAGRSGDHWIIAARRATPDTVMPWQLLSSAPPCGPRRFYAPLALICWEAPLQFLNTAQRNALDQDKIVAMASSESAWAVYGPIRASVIDARRRLTPLCIQGCTTILVGDGVATQGMVNDLEEAIDLLPEAGGCIRLLPGDHKAEVTLTARNNVTICGCGLKSQLVYQAKTTPLGGIYTQGPPLITLQDCTNIVLEDFVIKTESAVGIKLENVDDSNRDIRIAGVRFLMDGQHDPNVTYALTQAAILGLGGERVTIERCHIEVQDCLGYVPAIVIGATDLLIRDNYVRALESASPTVSTAMGGIQILSFSQRVEVSGNVIRGGWGHGISLGHLINVIKPVVLNLDADTSWASLDRMLGDAISNLRQFSPHGSEVYTPMAPDDFWTPGGPVIDVVIRDNHILEMGLSGISTGGFIDTNDGERKRFIVAINLDIHRNEIVNNMRIDTLVTALFVNYDTAVGGVCLAAAMNSTIRENRITNNGADFQTPICGVGIVTGQGVVIQDNVIADNGLEHDTPGISIPDSGLRGGVAIFEVSGTRGYHFPDSLAAGVTVILPTFDEPPNNVALTMRKNEVSQRIGKALWVLSGFGPIVVTENSLHGLGDPVTGNEIEKSELCYGAPDITYPAQGACVEIRNYAYSPAIDYTGAVIPKIALADLTEPSIEGGAIDFSANEVSLNWRWKGGYPASVVLSSLDSVKLTDNVMSANMNSSYVGSPSGADGQFLADVIADSIAVTPSMSFLLVHCWAGAPSTVQASGNRFEEGHFDCVFSYVGAHAAAFGDSTPDTILTQTTHATMIAMNVGSHCLVPREPVIPVPSIVNSDNIAIYQVVGGCACDVTVATGAALQQVCIT